VEEGETPEQTARREIREETGIEVGSPDAIGKEFLVREKNVVWDVHPFLFNVDTEKVVLDRENDAFRWAVPGEIPEADMVDGVPGILAELLKKD
jgi:8-oxo-dGTP pyrophosphatase MutT (NUDIX family)